METASVADPDVVANAAAVLRAGGVIIFPTDTLYGLGADALSDAAVEKIYAIKGRDTGKPIHAIVSDMEMAERYAVVHDVARRLAKQFLPGSLTIILKKREGINMGITKGIDTIGIRIPKNNFCLALAREFDAPITATSANRAGAATGQDLPEIFEQLGDSAKHVDLAIDAGELPPSLPSTVIDLSGGLPNILREGAISMAELHSYLSL
jgi:L-threonylcarbamoyladenylate synthase